MILCISGMIITWVTFQSTTQSVCEFGTQFGSLTNRTTGWQTLFVDGGFLKRKIYIHRVNLQNLTADTRYFYHVGGKEAWSSLFSFRTLKSGRDWAPRFAVYGDMGNKNARSLPHLQRESQQGFYDMIIHNGDFAYDMSVDNAKYGDQFFRQIEPIAAFVPYMVTPGNHEWWYNFTNYKNRFSMPGNTLNQYYSFDVGPVHVLCFSTEFYYYTQFGWHQIQLQYDWIKKDLAAAQANRKSVPWLITFGHRPMYCSNKDTENCTAKYTYIRSGDGSGLPGLENLFYENGVDLSIWAHEHSYERLWPLYRWNIHNGTRGPYVDPGAPVHLVAGSAGCQEDIDEFNAPAPKWSAFRSRDYGYARMTVHNHTHLYWEQVSAIQETEIDRFWLVKNTHGPY